LKATKSLQKSIFANNSSQAPYSSYGCRSLTVAPLPETLQKNSYAMVIEDYFSEWMEAILLPNQKLPQ